MGPCPRIALEATSGLSKKQLQDRVATTSKHLIERRQHPPAGQLLVGFNFPATCWFISERDLLTQLNVLPH